MLGLDFWFQAPGGEFDGVVGVEGGCFGVGLRAYDSGCFVASLFGIS